MIKWLQRGFLPLWLVGALGAQAQETVVTIGSKNFTESHLLAELMAQIIEARTELVVERRMGMGGTLVCFEALKSGEMDAYAEYTGTAWSVVLKEAGTVVDPLQTFLHVQSRFRAEYDLEWLQPFGLNNTYALVMNEERAETLGITRISDLLAHHAELKAGFSLEFLNREDGWPGLQATYGLDFGDVRGMEHALAYDAIRSGALDVIDAYSTDGKLLRYSLQVLEDDRGFFPPYNAAPVVRGALLREHPELREALEALAFRLPDHVVRALNHRVEENGEAFEDVARDFLNEAQLVEATNDAASAPRRGEGSFLSFLAGRWRETLELVLEHLFLTGVAVLLASLVAIPLGLVCANRPTLRRLSLGATSVLQTIPSLALLAFLIPFPAFGLGLRSAIAALFLYALLPILRNTVTGLASVDPELVEAARGLGLTERQILGRVKLPLSVRTILAGIRTATVIAVGVATLAAFIGAGGLGEPIATGLYLNDTRLILAGAIPAALLALLADLLLGWLERTVSPRGLE